MTRRVLTFLLALCAATLCAQSPSPWRLTPGTISALFDSL